MIITSIIITLKKFFASPYLKIFKSLDKIWTLSVPNGTRDNPTPKGGNGCDHYLYRVGRSERGWALRLQVAGPAHSLTAQPNS